MEKQLWEPSSWLQESGSDLGKSASGKISLLAHIFYIEFVDRLIDALVEDGGVTFTKIIVTTPSTEIQELINERVQTTGLDIIVVLYPNKGRNFGPLLCELRSGLIDTEYFVHIHSKKSPNRVSDVSKDWLERSWSLLLEGSGLLQRAYEILESDSSIATVSPLVNDFIPSYAFSWIGNEDEGSRVAQLVGLSKTPSRFVFPAGGMFLARTMALESLTSVPWDISWFPEELGQLDGTLQHAVERMIGLIPSLEGKSHAFFHEKLDAFTSDESFVVADGHQILVQDFANLQKSKTSWVFFFWSRIKSLLKRN